MEETTTCPSCKDDVVENEDAVQCDGCDHWWHYVCLKSPKREFTKIKSMPMWFCSRQCKQDIKQLSQMEMSPLVSGKLNKILESITNLTETINQLTTQNSELKKVTDEIKGNMKVVQKENEVMGKEIDYLKTQVNILQQEKLNNVLLCFGVSVKDKDDISSVMYNEFDKRGISVDGIMSFKIKSQKKNNKNPPPILLTFRNTECRNSMLASVKAWKKKERAKSVSSLDRSGDRFGVREMLTQLNFQLLTEAKLMLKTTFRFIWAQRGRILVKKDVNENIEWIKSQAHLLQLINKSQTSNINNSNNNINEELVLS